MATELRDTSPVPAPPPAAGAGRHRWRHLLGILGPGLVTGAADDDPSGIATYSQTGAQFGYGQLWTAAWMLPLVTGVQEACGRIGNVTGQGLARNIKNRYSLRTLRLLVTLLAVANVINIGADIGALGASAGLIIHLPAAVLMVLFTLVILTLEIAVIIAVPLIWFIDRIAADRDTMGEARSGWLSRTILLLTFLGVAGSVLAMAISYVKG